jgi:hypothetical protein
MRALSTKFAATALILAGAASVLAKNESLPNFARDTVLVWKITNQDEKASFVVRIAEFFPNRYIEWENAVTQGTIYIPNKALLNARTYISARLFEGGVDTKGKDATTLWLSRSVYRELTTRSRAKLAIDSIEGLMQLIGEDTLQVDVNRMRTSLDVIKVKDDRGQERWFLNSEDNPLMVRHLFRAYEQTLASISTDRPNTLRWIKGKKLSNPH